MTHNLAPKGRTCEIDVTIDKPVFLRSIKTSIWDKIGPEISCCRHCHSVRNDPLTIKLTVSRCFKLIQDRVCLHKKLFETPEILFLLNIVLLLVWLLRTQVFACKHRIIYDMSWNNVHFIYWQYTLSTEVMLIVLSVWQVYMGLHGFSYWVFLSVNSYLSIQGNWCFKTWQIKLILS